jgi:hypothetical protein
LQPIDTTPFRFDGPDEKNHGAAGVLAPPTNDIKKVIFGPIFLPRSAARRNRQNRSVLK